MNKINELYTQLSTSMPEIKPITSFKENIDNKAIDDISDEEAGIALDTIISKGYDAYKNLPPAQQLIAEVAPVTGEAISAVEAKKFLKKQKMQ